MFNGPARPDPAARWRTVTVDTERVGTVVIDNFDDVNGTHPFVFAQDEGFDIENRVLNVTSYGVVWFIDVSWAEVTAF